MSENILECEKISKRIGKRTILEDISIQIKEGDILGFIGPNGAGKTTTIKVILGLQKMTTGTVKINGFDIKKDFKKAIEKVGAIVETTDMYSYLSGYQNLKIVARQYEKN